MPYLLSCFTNSYGRFGPVACIERVGSAGLAYVELAIRTHDVPSVFQETPLLTDRSTRADVAMVRVLLEKHGVGLSSCNVTSGNPLEESVVETTLSKLAIASALGVGIVVGGGGDAVQPDQRRVLLGHLRRLGNAAGELGITYCCETHPGLCRNATRMIETMELLDHPHVRLNFDTGNILFYNVGADLLEELHWVREWVRHVHLKDHNGHPGDWCFPACGKGGAVDFSAVRRSLDEVGFSGPFSLEIEGIRGEPPLTLDQQHQRVVDSVEHLRRCGFDS